MPAPSSCASICKKGSAAYFDEILTEAVDVLDGSRVSEREDVGADADDVTMPLVEFDVCVLSMTFEYIKESPPPGQLCEEGTRVFIQSAIILVSNDTEKQRRNADVRPMRYQRCQRLFEQHGREIWKSNFY